MNNHHKQIIHRFFASSNSDTRVLDAHATYIHNSLEKGTSYLFNPFPLRCSEEITATKHECSTGWKKRALSAVVTIAWS